MIPMSLHTLGDALKGKVSGDDLTVRSVTTDSRQKPSADLFIALKGERFDAHHYIHQAINHGAKSVLISQPVACSVPSILVENTHTALGQLGRIQRQHSRAKVIALTGSVGKTSVKEMLASILRLSGKTLATSGNFNNDIGVPLTLCELTEDIDYAVIELGANHIGEIDYTASLVQPHVALINNVAAAHLEGFGSIHGVAQAKGEIYSHLKNGGTAIVNIDDEYAPYWSDSIGGKRLTFGYNEKADITANHIEVTNAAVTFELLIQEHNVSTRVKLNVPGKHNVMNALAATACCVALAIPVEKIVAGLQSFSGVAGRLQILTFDQVTLIDDSYNANYASLAAAIDVLKQQNGRKLLALGDMAELGELGRAYHEKAGTYAKSQGIDELLTVGELSYFATVAFGDSARHFSSQQALIEYLKKYNNQPASILLKGSRSAHMENIVNALAPRSNYSKTGGMR